MRPPCTSESERAPPPPSPPSGIRVVKAASLMMTVNISWAGAGADEFHTVGGQTYRRAGYCRQYDEQKGVDSSDPATKQHLPILTPRWKTPVAEKTHLLSIIPLPPQHHRGPVKRRARVYWALETGERILGRIARMQYAVGTRPSARQILALDRGPHPHLPSPGAASTAPSDPPTFTLPLRPQIDAASAKDADNLLCILHMRCAPPGRLAYIGQPPKTPTSSPCVRPGVGAGDGKKITTKEGTWMVSYAICASWPTEAGVYQASRAGLGRE
ncbi:hypothetical protein C8F04DRAFT_1394084 [Mycena alexandri]|uniref:Uncharacterized protein n=1 Tax=Mycena alexandri TaxID=1745969 RepID=A0AAD6X622_9AGAR|nr:hypothetical protein C8F04DRAFT_1394084 [Mycena alexandri]